MKINVALVRAKSKTARLTQINAVVAASANTLPMKLERGGRIVPRAARLALFLILSAAAAVPAWAQEGNARRGLVIALETCAVCHGVRKNERSSNTNAPPFELIAAVPGMTRLALQSMLQTSHREMPNFILQPDERADLIAYILSLNTN